MPDEAQATHSFSVATDNRPTWITAPAQEQVHDLTPLHRSLEDLRFQEKAGFMLSALQQQDVMTFLSWGKVTNLYEVGGGKTVVSSIKAHMAGHHTRWVLVPPILISPWAKWLRQFWNSVLVYRGTPKVRMQLDIAAYQWVVMSHAIFRQDYEKRFKFLETMDKEIIVDEAHALKNPGSVLFQRVAQAIQPTDGLQLLTGTPINRPEDAYSYIKLTTPHLYRTIGHFEMIHVVDRDIYDRPTGYDNLDMLKDNLQMRSISRTKGELHGYNLKPLTPDSSYDLDPAHMKLYEQLVEDRLLELPDGGVIDVTTVQKLRHALQQVVCNWGHFAGDPTKRAAAYDLIDNTIDEVGVEDRSRSKLIIWTNYKMTSRSVTEYLNKRGIPTVAAYGEADSERSVDLFMNDDSTRILVAQYQSAGAGLNPQHVCSEAIFLELSTVTIYMRQAAGRIDRVGQKKIPRMKFARANGTVQVGLLDALLSNDDRVQRIEPSKKSIRDLLLGGTGRL